MTYQTVFACVVTALLATSVPAHGNDLEDLKATFEQEVAAFNARDFNTYVQSAHEQVIVFGHFPPFEVEGIEAYRQRYHTLFDKHQSVTFTPLNPQFRVIGDIGIAWGHYQLATKPKDGPPSYSYGRYMFTYTQSGKRWLILSMHLSRLHPTS